MFKSLASRLTILYSLLFAVLSLIVFSVMSLSLKSSLLDRIDQDFSGDGREFVEIYQQGGLAALAQEITLETEGEGVDEIFIRIYSPALQIVEASDLRSWGELPTNRSILEKLNHREFETITLHGGSERARIFYQPLGDGYILQTGVLLTSDEKLFANFQQVFILAFSLMLLCSILIGFYISKRALAGVQRVRETADQISRGNLSQPISFQGQTEEINNLISSINRMQLRIQSLIKELQDVTNNIAHDLRSPITRIRGLAETTLSGNQSLEDYQAMSGAVIEECDSLVSMINTMLEIAETDSGVKPLAKQPINIAEIIRDVSELYAPVAEDKKVNVSLNIEDDPLVISGDRGRLQRAFANLLDNSLKFTPEGGRIALEVKKVGHRARITVADSGIGISIDDLPHIRERFYRADRSRSTPGTGLGLSLVQSIIQAHGGRVDISSEVNTGTQAIIHLNLAEK